VGGVFGCVRGFESSGVGLGGLEGWSWCFFCLQCWTRGTKLEAPLTRTSFLSKFILPNR
jgi:hypothetical protein